MTANDVALARKGEVSGRERPDRSLAGQGAASERVENRRVGNEGAESEGQSWFARRGVALGKLLRTTTFKLTLVYLTVFALFAAFLLAYFAWNTRRLITEQITETVDAEIQGLSEQYRQGGIRRIVFAIEGRARRPGSSLYLLTTAAGELVAGNVGALATGILDNPGWSETVYRRVEEQDPSEHRALVRVDLLPGGFHLLVGRDLDERERLYDVVLAAGRWSVAIVVVLGLAGGFFVTRRVLKRIDAITETSRNIMQGDLHERLPIAGTGDEIDRLAINLNAMLERIEALMLGFKEVSDNIAHDLKTPLTRLRNRCEEALRAAGSEAQYREALGSTIEESEALIRTFNALLMIARAESGQAGDEMTTFDAAEIVRGIGDLYEPLADDKGLTLKVEAAAAVWVRGNRELISQAFNNLVDNAIKYGASGNAAPGQPAAVVLRAMERGDRILLSVADSGPGIAQSDRGRVLERFVRLEQSRSEPGSGLGLSLAAAIARLHGGELLLEDNHPGLVSVILLPRVAVPKLATSPSAAVPAALPPAAST